MRGRRGLRVLGIGAALALLALTTLLATRNHWVAPVGRAAADWLDVSDFDGPVDCVMILGGEPNRRPFAAAALYRAGLAERVLVARTRPSEAARRGLIPLQHELARQVLALEGVPETAIEILPGEEVRSTADEAVVLGAWLEARPEVEVVVLTTAYHTRRARRIFRQVLGAAAPRVEFLGIPPEDFRSGEWWRTKAGFLTYSREFLKTLYYWLRY